MDATISLSWGQILAISGGISGIVGTLFWLLIAEKDRSRARAEKQTDDLQRELDEERRAAALAKDKLISTAEAFGEIAKQTTSMYQDALKRGGPGV